MNWLTFAVQCSYEGMEGTGPTLYVLVNRRGYGSVQVAATVDERAITIDQTMWTDWTYHLALRRCYCKTRICSQRSVAIAYTQTRVLNSAHSRRIVFPTHR